MTEVSSRSVALECLMLIAEEHRFSHTVLNEARNKYAWMSSEDRAFFTRLVHGTLEYLEQADRILDQRSSVKTRKMKPVIRNILRMSVYQLLYLDRIPARAVINEAVRITAMRGLHGLKGFVNAVLRRIASEREEILKEIEASEDLSYRYSMPEWITKLFLSCMERNTAEQVMKAFLEPQPTYVRFLRTGGASSGSAGASVPETGETALCPDIRVLKQRGQGGDLGFLRDGTAYIQDLSSALAVRAAAPAPGETVMDLCAAPGGKSIAAADRMEGRGSVLSFDLTENKAEMIRENAARCGFDGIIRAEVNDAAEFRGDLCGTADLLIADLPCSGLGVLGQKPDIKLNVRPEMLRELRELQRRILKNAAQYVRPGGRLLYSTCTIDPLENEENRAWFLQEHKEFRPVDLRELLPEAEKTEQDAIARGQRKKSTLSEGCFQLLPDLYPCDGFFFALFQKND